MKKDKNPKDDIFNAQSSKMRIKVYDQQGLIQDRLVEQSTELRMGPKEVIKGSFSLEFNLNSQEDVDLMIEYIKKLKGELPLTKVEKKSLASKKLNDMLSDKEPLLDLLKTVEAKAKTQEQLISSLREYNFMFVDMQTVLDVATKEQITLRDKDIEKGYQYMVRRIKEAKDPAKDKFDWRLTFGIKIVGEKTDIVQVYLWGKRDKFLKLPWEKKKVNFKKVEIFSQFPEPMTYDERKRWRLEHRKLETNFKKEGEGKVTWENYIGVKASKFYLRWKPYIKTF